MRRHSIVAESPDAYVASLSGWRGRYAVALRSAVLEAAPLREVIKWSGLQHLPRRSRRSQRFEVPAVTTIPPSSGRQRPLRALWPAAHVERRVLRMIRLPVSRWFAVAMPMSLATLFRAPARPAAEVEA
jgi:hypothetical protein